MGQVRVTVPPADCIPFKEKVGYALGDSAANLYWKTFEFFLVIFYTDVFGIPAAAAGMVLLVTRLGDAGADLLMGSIADRTQTRWGHFGLIFVERSAIGRGGRADLHDTSPWRRAQASLRLYYVWLSDAHLHHCKHSLQRTDGRNDAKFRRAHFDLLDPFRGRVHSRAIRTVLHTSLCQFSRPG